MARLVKKAGKPAAAAVLAVLVLALTGCNASVNLYSYTTDEYYVQTLEIRMSDTLRKTIEDSAGAVAGTSEKWKLTAWLRDLSLLLTFSDGSRYEYSGYKTENGDFVVPLVRKVPLSALDDQEDDEEVTVVRKNYFWFYTYEITEPNPFNGLRADYDAGTEDTVMGYIKNGVWENGVQILPSLTEAFPVIAGYDPSDLKLNLYLAFSDTISATGTWTTVDGRRYCLYERSFDDAQHTITYKYRLPNSVGWNVTALVIAAIVVAAILLATRKEKTADDRKQIKFNY